MKGKFSHVMEGIEKIIADTFFVSRPKLSDAIFHFKICPRVFGTINLG